MTEESLSLEEQAEAYLIQGEKAGLKYPDYESRDAAKARMIIEFGKEAKQELATAAAAASEGGQPVGSGEEMTVEEISAELSQLNISNQGQTERAKALRAAIRESAEGASIQSYLDSNRQR